MKHMLLGAALIGGGALIGNLSPDGLDGAAQAQVAPLAQSGDALWHLPKFADSGWFLHASNGRVRACNMDKTSVVNDRVGPRCSEWR